MSISEDRQKPILPADLPHDDVLATESAPEEVVEALARRRLDIFIGGRRATAEELCAALRDQGELVLPEGFSTELAVRSVVNAAEADGDDEPAETGRSYRPPWVNLEYRPRPLTVPPIRNLRAADGRIVRPLQGVALPSWMTETESIYGRDDRQPHIPGGFPWHCIGKLNTYVGGRSVGGGTATLVGRRTIVTAAHVMPMKTPTWLYPGVPDPDWSAEFIAADVFDLPLTGDGGRSWVTDAYGYFSPDAGNDLMIMRLNDPLGDLLGWMGFRTYDDDWEDEPRWTHVGYPSSKYYGKFPCRQEHISVDDDDSGPNDSLELETYGDAGPGDSGGPLFGMFGTDAQIVGVMSGNYWSPGGPFGIGAYDYNVDAGGNALTKLCWYGRNNWD
jgi:V8-like Glu-specific endopeptidase